MSKKKIIIISLVVIAIIILIVTMTKDKISNSRIDINEIFEENNISYTENEISYKQYNAMDGIEYITSGGTRIWMLTYDKARSFYEGIVSSNKIYIEGTDVDFDITLFDDKAIYVYSEGTDIDVINELLNK